jgi:hypothetical protein
MPFVTWACVTCRELRDVWVTVHHKVAVTGECVCCGEPLTRPGTIEFRLVHFEVNAARTAAKIRQAARRPRARCRSPFPDLLEENVRHNTKAWAVDLAHQARDLYRELRFEFETDASGRPLEEGRTHGTTTRTTAGVLGASARQLHARQRDVGLRRGRRA